MGVWGRSVRFDFCGYLFKLNLNFRDWFEEFASSDKIL